MAPTASDLLRRVTTSYRRRFALPLFQPPTFHQFFRARRQLAELGRDRSLIGHTGFFSPLLEVLDLLPASSTATDLTATFTSCHAVGSLYDWIVQ